VYVHVFVHVCVCIYIDMNINVHLCVPYTWVSLVATVCMFRHTSTSMHMWVDDEETMNIDEETMNVGFLTARNCTSELTVKLLDRKEPITLVAS